MVITSDEGRFADGADDLRQNLQNQGRAVTGARTNVDHFDHAAMLATSGNDLAALVQQDRAGTAQNLLGGTRESAFKTTTDMMTKVNKEVIQIRKDAAGIDQDVSAFAGPKSANLLKSYADWAGDSLQKALDLIRNMPAGYGVWKQQVEAAASLLRKNLVTLGDLQNAAGGAVNSPVALVDALQVSAREALDKLTQAGGPSRANRDLENAVLEEEAALGRLHGATVDAQLAGDIDQAAVAIRLRRTQALNALKIRKERRGAAIRPRGNG